MKCGRESGGGVSVGESEKGHGNVFLILPTIMCLHTKQLLSIYHMMPSIQIQEYTLMSTNSTFIENRVCGQDYIL